MTWDRRDFVRTSSLALVGSAVGRLPLLAQDATPRFEELRRNVGAFHMRGGTIGWLISDNALVVVDRSEERRVGKECRSRCAPYH